MPPTYEDINSLRDRLMKLETQIGQTPEEGLRAELAKLQKSVIGMEVRSYMAYGVCLAIIFVIEHFFSRT